MSTGGSVRGIASVFQQIVEEYPHATALDGPGGKLTYAQLDRRADGVAWALRAAGVGRKSIVANAFECSIDAVVATLATLKAGAAYCPLDLADPPTRHAWTLDDIRPAALLTSRPINSQLPSHAAPRIYLEDIAHESEPFKLESPSHADDPACVMYTSGSTGRPKAALIPHRGIARLVLENSYVPFSSGLRVLMHSPMHFDAITFELWAPLLHGGACIIFGGGAVPSLREFRTHIRDYRVNTVFMGPAVFNLIIDQEPDLLDGIENMLVGGEALSPTHIRKAQAHLPHTRFINGYGPTETTTFAVTYVIPRPLPADAVSVPIGTPLARTTCYLLDADGQPVAENTEGELFIGGDGVALGYLNRPELTAERFLPDPFSTQANARMYRTGDLCRRLPTGLIDFIGRADGQVKIRGRRIELGEIEANVLQHPQIAQCFMTVQKAGDDKHLICYFVPRAGKPCSADSLRGFLAERLPFYLVPRDLIRLTELPRRRNGKVDTAALPLPRASNPNTAADAVAVTTGATADEQLLLALWRDAAENPALAPDDCFFTTGGTSLAAIRLCCLLERATGRTISIAELAAHSTPRKMAAHLAAEQVVDHANPPVLLLNAAGAPMNLFCIAGHIWNPHSLTPVIANLNGVATAYGLNYPGMDATSDPIADTAALASYFINAMRALQPRGPYSLMGYSYGGIVAFEMCQQLLRDGERVHRLILLDSILVRALTFKSPAGRALVHARQLIVAGPTLLARRIREHKRPKPPKIVPTDPGARRIFESQEIYKQAFRGYDPRPYPGDAMLITVTERDEWMHFTRDPKRGGWPGIIQGKLFVKRVPGNHYTFVEPPHAARVASLVRLYLTQPLRST